VTGPPPAKLVSTQNFLLSAAAISLRFGLGRRMLEFSTTRSTERVVANDTFCNEWTGGSVSGVRCQGGQVSKIRVRLPRAQAAARAHGTGVVGRTRPQLRGCPRLRPACHTGHPPVRRRRAAGEATVRATCTCCAACGVRAASTGRIGYAAPLVRDAPTADSYEDATQSPVGKCIGGFEGA
jgi:hypothetical protein